MKTIEELGISPAPWKTDVGVYSFWVDDNAGELVCMKNSTGMNDRNIGRRNARLIAAAPDLYEALRVCVEELNKARKKLSNEEYFAPTIATNMAYAALEKAGGAE